MMNRQYCAWVTVFFGFFCTFAKAATGEAMKEAEVAALIPAIEAYVGQSMQTWSAPGVAIAIVAEDRVVYAKGFGERRLGSAEPVTEETVFQIGSTSKAFAAATEAIAVDKGLFGWDDRVIDHFDAFYLYDPWVTREFRMIDLLAQRSGLPAYALTDMTLYGYDADAIIAAMRYIEPVSSFRNVFAYQNTFHLIAGKIIAQASGEPDWGSFTRKHLLEPLGMAATFTTLEQALEYGNVAIGHHPEDGKVIADPFYAFPYNVLPAGGLMSSVKDMGQWLRLQINAGTVDGKKIVSSANLWQTWLPRVVISSWPASTADTDSKDVEAPNWTSYANGWIVHSGPEGRIIEHGGSTAGFNSQVAFDPDRKVGVVVLSNLCVDVGPGCAFGIGMYVMDLLQGREPVDHSQLHWDMLGLGEPSDEDRESQPLPLPASAYAGTYASKILGEITVTANDDGTLHFTLGPRQIPVVLSHQKDNLFSVAIYPPVNGVFADGEQPAPMRINGHAFFSIGADGRATHFELDAMDSAGQPPFVRVVE